ncbi:MAG: thiamine phosphate synthase, partial [Deltaproteobacteria bacterium]|nr:thiamine phosphate synthase [Deltaproteobacteria bacterium]
HTADELVRALADRPDYVAFGPVWETASKDRAEPVVGLGALEVASEQARRAGVPLVAIGGVDLARAPDLARLGVAAAAISALFPANGLESVPAWVAELHSALGGA